MSKPTTPETVAAQYRTVGGATVDISHDVFYLTDTEPNVSFARCGGCGADHDEQWGQYAYRFNNGSRGADYEAAQWAQSHAEKCRALPRA